MWEPCQDHLACIFQLQSGHRRWRRGETPGRSFPKAQGTDGQCGSIPAPHPQPQQSPEVQEDRQGASVDFSIPPSTETDTCVPPLCRAAFSSRNYTLSIYV